jgi:DNA-binding NarL/FixJ family response regulator
MKVLIIEDNKAQAEALCRLLTARMDFVECKIVHTLEDGLFHSIEFRANVTLLDLCLPGKTVTEVIHSIPRLVPPVVVVSELIRDNPDIQLECIAFNAKGVLTKEALAHKIDSFVGTIEADKLIAAITLAHLINVMPSKRNEFCHGPA